MDQKPAKSYWKVFFSSLVLFFCLVLIVEGWYYWYLKERISAVSLSHQSSPSIQSFPSPQPSPSPPASVPAGEFIAKENIDVYDSPGGEKLGFFVPGQSFTPTDKRENDWIEVIDTNQGHIIWIRKDSSYQPMEL